jgi:GMP synthase (glutamine-hydrolysing)
VLLVVENEVDPERRYLGPELVRSLPDAEYHVYPDDPVEPSVADLDGVVLSGSTASVYDGAHADWVRPQTRLVEACLDAAVPTLGICFGHQLVNHALGGTVEADEFRSGFVRLTDRDDGDRLLAGLEPLVPVIHGDAVVEPGRGMGPTAATAYSDYFCTRHESAPVWTVGFHPELTPETAASIDEFRAPDHGFEATDAGRVLDRFAAVCGLAPAGHDGRDAGR